MTSQINAREPVSSKTPTPAMVIAYLAYAVADVRALSARSTSLLEKAIETLREETGTGQSSVNDMH